MCFHALKANETERPHFHGITKKQNSPLYGDFANLILSSKIEENFIFLTFVEGF
jgi:hypothetical protein